MLKIYSHNELREKLAFRGGTALNKLFFNPPSRYSEDIDLVQINKGTIGSIIDDLRSVFDSWLGEPKKNYSNERITLIYRTLSDDGFPIKLKIEINTIENFSVFDLLDYNFVSQSSWANGSTINQIEEMLSTKLRALYQRRKGRDLYDLYIASTTLENLDTEKIIYCFKKYMNFEKNKISTKLFMENMNLKMQNPEFLNDMLPLFPKSRMKFDPAEAYELVLKNLITKL